MAPRKTLYVYRGVTAPPESASWTPKQFRKFCDDIDAKQPSNARPVVRCAKHDRIATRLQGRWRCPVGRHDLGNIRTTH